MSKQSSIEWLVEQCPRINTIASLELIEQAKAMEKQQITDAYRFGLSDEYVIGSEQYYTKTYGSNHIGDANKMVEAEEKPMRYHCVPKELPTDDVLFQQAILAMEQMYGSGCDAEIDAYFRGVKWMQKQLKLSSPKTSDN